VIEHCLSYDNRTRNDVDGNGFGLDQNTSYSYLEYNLSYGNEGTGYLVYSAQDDGAQKHNVVRDNISSGDSRKGSGFYAGISVVGQVQDTDVYQNTVVMTSAYGSVPALRLGTFMHGISVRNNIFATEAAPIVAAGRALPVSMAVLQGNDYYSALGSWSVVWGQASYPDLSAWRTASSEETVGAQPSGFTVNPQLAGPVLGLQAKLASQTSAGNGFTLRPGSPLAGAGLDLTSLFGLNPGSRDYSGKAVSTQHPNVGAQ
jgi:hypothetical protein